MNSRPVSLLCAAVTAASFVNGTFSSGPFATDPNGTPLVTLNFGVAGVNFMLSTLSVGAPVK
jgi:hypothetical protein